MPFGTKEIADSSRELGEKIDKMIDNMHGLNKGTAQLAESMHSFQSEMDHMNENFLAMTSGIEGFRSDMQTMTKEIKNMANSTNILNQTLKELSKNMSGIIIDNVKDLLGINRFLKNSK